ncbi:MAG: tetratricopeptide repeat protein [Candidatus Eisenbacteria bacterium]
MNRNHVSSAFGSVLRRTCTAVALVLAIAAPAFADDLKDARTALAAGQLDQAQQLFERVASQGFADGRSGVGLVLLKRRDYTKAAEAFELARKMDGNNAMAWYGLGEVRRDEGNLQGAVEMYRKAVDLDRKFPEAQLALGDCLRDMKQYGDAITALAPGLNWGAKWRPKFLVAHGNVELARDSLRDAGIYFTQAQQAAPDDPVTNRALGDFYLKRGIGSLAIPSYEKAVELDTSDVELRQALGTALYFDQRYNDALEQFRWVTQRDPEFAPGQFSLGKLYYLSGAADPRRYAEAKPYLEKYTQLMPADSRGWAYLGQDLYYLKMKPEAIAAMTKAVELGEKSKDMFTVLGRAYVDTKEWAKAIDAYGRGEPNTQDLFKIGQVHALLGNVAAADSVYQGMIAKDSTTSEARFAMQELGKLKFRLKDYPGAVAMLQRRIALDPNSDEAYYYIGLSYKEMKQLPEAVDALRQATLIAPGKADRHFWLGVVLSSMADSTAQSVAAFTQFIALDSSSKNAGLAYQQLGYQRLLVKDWAGAVDLLERSAAITAADVNTQVWLGQGYQNMGNRAKAIEAYRRALGLDPNNEDAKKGLKSLGN